MTNERAKEILKRYTTRIRSLEEHALPDLEETEALFVAYKALEQLESQKQEQEPKAQPLYVKIIPVSYPLEPTPEDWANGSEFSKFINGIVEQRMKALELEKEQKEGET